MRPARFLLLSICFALCLSLLLAVTPPLTTPVKAATWYVNPGDSIQSAIDASASGDTIIVAAGTYHENLVVNKDLILLGAQAGVDARGRVASETLVGTVSGTALYARNPTNSITVDGFSFIGGRPIVETTAQIVTFVNNICSLTDAGGSDGVVQMHGGALQLFIQHNDILAQSVYVNPDSDALGITISSAGTAVLTIDGNTLHNASGSGLQFVSVNSGVVTGTVSNNDIFDNRGDGITITDSHFNTLDMTRNNIHDNDGWGVNIAAQPQESDIDINYNNIYGNALGGVNNDNTWWVDATYNWWGADDGPGPLGPGSGDGVSDFVRYDFWLPLSGGVSGASMPRATTITAKSLALLDWFLGQWVDVTIYDTASPNSCWRLTVVNASVNSCGQEFLSKVMDVFESFTSLVPSLLGGMFAVW